MNPAMTTDRTGIPVLTRGVHLLPCRDGHGRLQAVAVDSRGHEVARASITPKTFLRANTRLWAALYRSDPR